MKACYPFAFLSILLSLSPSFLFSSPRLVKAARTDKRIRIDGKLDEPSWRLAQPSGNFTQKYPVEDTIPSESTTVRVIYDKRNLYVGVRAYDSEPGKIVGRLSRRDVWEESDNIAVYIDSYFDRRTCYTFETNPRGVKIDWYIYDDSWTDWSWDAVWDVETNIDSLGWTAEFAIPFSILRFQNKDSLEFGFEVIRYISRKRETVEWEFISEDVSGFVSCFGMLTGIYDISAPKNLEFLPYGAGRLTDEEEGKYHFCHWGCNLKYGISSNFILDAAVNPDFGQVEADPSQLNLSVFETYYQEKRPFFMEGKDLFETEYELFYSRRIGKSLGYFSILPSDVIKEQPEFTTIIGAMKLTGKVKGLNFGLVEAITAPEYAVVDSQGVERKRLIEPLTNYSVVRIKQDVLETSYIGLISTACNRKQGNSAYSGGLDWDLRLLKNYSFEGQIALSKVDNKEYADYFRLGKAGGRIYNWGASYSEVSRNFDIRDMGYVYRNNERNAGGWFSLFTSDPCWITHRMAANLNIWHSWNFESLIIEDGLNSGWWITFNNYWSINLFWVHEFPIFNDWITRGVPALLVPSSDWINISFCTDSRKSVYYGISTGIGNCESKSFSNSIWPYISLKTFSNFKTTFSASYSHSFDYAEWISNIDDDADGIIDHYVFGEMTTDVLSTTIRSDIAFTKNITLQLWMQPYIAVGEYSNYKELIDANDYAFTPYHIETFPDFNQKFLKLNVVFRWQYSPGSTVYFVITNSLADFSHPGDFSPIRDLKSAFTAKGERIYLIKINKWLSL